jgi:alpha-L-arabinofuranosidase
MIMSPRHLLRTAACLFAGVLALTLASPGSAGTAPVITVNADKPGHAISPVLWGIFFEDINLSADGGLYAELIRNRNFEDSDKPDHWSVLSSGAAEVSMSLDTAKPVSAKNSKSLKVTVKNPGTARVGVANGGYYGIAVRKGAQYDLSFLARAESDFAGPLTVSLESGDSVVYSQAKVSVKGADWKKYTASFKANETDPKARLVISATKPGTFYLDMVSLFPRKTWKNRPNDLRPDLAEMLVGLKPAFVRFPGGCWVEGDTMAQAYRWKQTIGDISERRTQHNIWQYEATHGIGYHEYLQLCEDLKSEPLFVINCGMSHRENVPMDKMPEFVQDALDAIEYANGPASSLWGSVRAKNGHPAPFKMKYLEIGNENGGPAYHERYALFHDAIKAKYPEMILIANVWGGQPKNRPVAIVDEHYYSTPEFFIANATKYDTYDRKGPKVYVGEYAVTQNGGEGNLRAAIGEAAFMTGMERNSDVVAMASYAPLFVNVNHKRWNPDLICYDSARVYGIPGYYVQKLFSENRGDISLPVSVDAPEVEAGNRAGGVGVGTWLTRAEFKDMKVTCDGKTLFAADFSNGDTGWRKHGGRWSVAEGAFKQEGTGENIRAFVGDSTWSNYTYSLKARKLGGEEGFLIPFLVRNEGAKCWWNIGGWGNTRHALEMDGITGGDKNGRIETGRWYDIRIELNPKGIKCYLDNELIHDVAYPRIKPLYASASREGKDLILKVVNASAEPQTTQLNLTGTKIAPKAKVTVLTSEKPEDENSLDQPTKVAPVTRTLNNASGQFSHTFPGNSFTVFRFRE